MAGIRGKPGYAGGKQGDDFVLVPPRPGTSTKTLGVAQPTFLQILDYYPGAA
jgi:hypothetical protein